MKTRYGFLFVMAIFAGLFLSQQAIAGNDGSSNGDHGGQQGIPLYRTAGQYAVTDQGSYAFCVSSTSPFPEESCAAAGAIVVPLTALDTGEITQDSSGNACGTFTAVFSNLPVDISPPAVVAFHTSATLLNYEPSSGIGDHAFTTYTGGNCNGAHFDSTGATITSTGTDHFVASEGGNRIDDLFTGFH